MEGRVSRSLAEGFENPPHLWYSPERRELYQTVDLRTPAYALLHPRGTPETNHRGPCLQVEIEGYARDTRSWPAEWYENIAQDVVRPLEIFCQQEYGQPLVVGRSTTALVFADERDGLGRLASTRSAVRMGDTEWRVAHGLVGHQHVPDNSHWDPGHFRMAELLPHLADPYEPRTLIRNPNGWEPLRGSDVKQWQNLLVILGVFPRDQVDSMFGAATDLSTRQLQLNLNMEPTGVVDANLIAAARDAVVRQRFQEIDLRESATPAPAGPSERGSTVVRTGTGSPDLTVPTVAPVPTVVGTSVTRIPSPVSVPTVVPTVAPPSPTAAPTVVPTVAPPSPTAAPTVIRRPVEQPTPTTPAAPTAPAPPPDRVPNPAPPQASQPEPPDEVTPQTSVWRRLLAWFGRLFGRR